MVNLSNKDGIPDEEKVRILVRRLFKILDRIRRKELKYISYDFKLKENYKFDVYKTSNQIILNREKS